MVFPDGFIQRISCQGYIDPASLLIALDESSPVSIRINRRKWKGTPLNQEPVPWSGAGYYLPSRPSFTADPLYHSGCYYPQEASGMFLEEVFKQVTGTGEDLRVLDLCGAPGGKTTVLADLLHKGSLLVSNEVISSRAAVLAETVTRWGSGNIIVTRSDPGDFRNIPGFFDVVTVDAPCSGEGMFRTETARSEWSVPNTLLCAERQKRILMDVWPSLKENGILIYSTCTFNPSENEDMVEWLTSGEKAVSLKLDIAQFPGINEIRYGNIWGYGFYPGMIKGEGFFIAAVRKTGKCEKRTVSGRGSGYRKPISAELNAARQIAEFTTDIIINKAGEMTALPCSLQLFESVANALRVIKPGTALGIMKRDDLIPSHDLAMSSLRKEKAFNELELSLSDSISYLRRDSLEEAAFENGWNIVKYRGIPLGFLKNIGKRVNNYYPVNLRIRMGKDELAMKEIISWM